MPIAWRDGAAEIATSATTTAEITIPATVQAGDIVWVLANLGTPWSAGDYSTISCASTGTAPVQAGTTQQVTFSGNVFQSGAVFWFAATAGDAGAVITVTAGLHDAYISIALGAWSGTAAIQPDVITGGVFGAGGATSFSQPTASTSAADCWEIDFCGGSTASASFSANPLTLRESAGCSAAIADSGGSVGAAGTPIGGGTWTTGDPDTGVMFTVGLAPVIPPPALAGWPFDAVTDFILST